MKKILLCAAVLFGLLAAQAMAADAQPPIKIGALQCFSTCARWAEPTRNGWQLAIDEINASGGVLGRKLELVTRDDKGDPDAALLAADDLLLREKVSVITGPVMGNVVAALSSFAVKNQLPYITGYGAVDDLTWKNGNDFTFVDDESPYTQAKSLAQLAATLPAKRWATLAPNYVYGRDFVHNFEEELKKLRPDVTFVREEWPAIGHLGAENITSLFSNDPQGVLVTAFTQDLAKFIREGNIRGLFTKNRVFISSTLGIPEEMDYLGKEIPEGWYVQTYPWRSIDTPEHKAFVSAYEAKFNVTPKLGSLYGYISIKQIAAAIVKAGSVKGVAIAKAAKGLEIDTPVGPIKFREIDNRSNFGFWIGRTVQTKDGPSVVVIKRNNIADLSPPDDWIRAQRNEK
ncbi:MAG: ABC transporter substrate-binding protein [Alphaproteobacteria bacterium]|nr:ABC transporter substrate-binding protein [Alphaproteobacteria bacterium]